MTLEKSRNLGDLEGRAQAAGLLALFNRHPVISAVAIWALSVILGIVVGLAATALVPTIPHLAAGVPQLPDFVALCVLTAATAILVSVLGWWRVVGCNRPAEWRNLWLLALPTLVVLLPLVRGFKAVDAGTAVFLLVGYLLTGFNEETLYRGVILRVLRPTGVWPSVLISSLLFGLAHSTNLFLRFSGNPVLVGLQIFGAFTFGIGMAALRLRTNTLWPLMVLHALVDFFLAVGQLPILLVDPIIDTVLLVYGIFLIRGFQQRKP